MVPAKVNALANHPLVEGCRKALSQEIVVACSAAPPTMLAVGARDLGIGMMGSTASAGMPECLR